MDTAPESCDSSSSLFATFFYTQEQKSKGRTSHQYHQCQARQQQTPNPRKPQENHKKPQEIRRSLVEHLWNMGLLSAFPDLDELLWTSLDFGYSGDGLCTQGCQRSLNLCELLRTSWNATVWAESVSDCFCFCCVPCFNRKNGTEIATIRNPRTLTYRSNRSIYHIISQHINHNISKAMQGCVPSSPFLLPNLWSLDPVTQ